MSAKKNIWFVTHPLFLYKDDVKALAKEKGLKIIDAAYYDESVAAENTPKLTLVADAGESGSKEPTVEELKAKLNELKVSFDAKAKKPELLTLLADAQKPKEPTVEELKAVLTEKGVSFKDDATLDELKELEAQNL